MKSKEKNMKKLAAVLSLYLLAANPSYAKTDIGTPDELAKGLAVSAMQINGKLAGHGLACKTMSQKKVDAERAQLIDNLSAALDRTEAGSLFDAALNEMLSIKPSGLACAGAPSTLFPK